MVNNMVNVNDNNDETEPPEYEFIDGDDWKSFLREHPPHVLYLWHLLHKYGILRRVRQQLDGGSTVDGTNAPSADTRRGRTHQVLLIPPSVTVAGLQRIWNKFQTQSMDLLVLQGKLIRHDKLTCSTGTASVGGNWYKEASV